MSGGRHFRTSLFFFFFNDTATTEIYTLSLHDALPILVVGELRAASDGGRIAPGDGGVGTLSVGKLALNNTTALSYDLDRPGTDRKSTRLNSSHANISYAVFCLKKKKKRPQTRWRQGKR